MRRFIVTGCALILLVQASCTSAPEEDPAPDLQANAKKSSPAPVFNPPFEVSPPAPKKKADPGGIPREKEFFSQDDVKPPSIAPLTPSRRIDDSTLPTMPPVQEDKEPQPEQPPEPVVVAQNSNDKKDDQKKNGDKKNDEKGKDFEIGKVIPPKMSNGKSDLVRGDDLESESFRIGGKTIDEWIKDIPSKDKSKSENAIRTVLLFGPKLRQKAAIPIARELKSHDPHFKPLDVSIRVNAVIALGEILAEPHEPDPKTVKAAVYYINKVLRDSQVVVKVHAARALAKIGPAAASAIPILIENISDRSTWEVRQTAALALGSVAQDKTNGPSIPALQALYGALKVDSSSQVRLAAIQSLAYLGAPPNPEQAAIVQQKLDEVALSDPEGTVQIWAHMAVMSIGRKIEPERLKYISRLLANDELTTRIQAAKALWAIGLEAKSEIPNLIGALDDREVGVVYWSMMALTEMGRWSEEALPKLRTLANDKEQPTIIRQTAQHTIDVVTGKKNKDMKKN